MIMTIALTLSASMAACGVTPAKQDTVAQTVYAVQEATDAGTSSATEETAAVKEENVYCKELTGTQNKATQIKTTQNKAMQEKAAQNKVTKSTAAQNKKTQIKATDVRFIDQKKKINYFEGIVTDVQKDSITVTSKTLSVTFPKNSSTGVINGTPEIGDDIIITYEGELGGASGASGIEVVRKADHERYMLTGKIEKSDGTFLLVSAGDAAYYFDMDNNTIVSGDRLAPGNKADVIYVNRLDQKPLAISVYCTEKETQKKSQKDTAKKVKTAQKKKTKEKKADAKKKIKKQKADAKKHAEPAQKEQMQIVTVVSEPAREPENDQDIIDVPENETPEEPVVSNEPVVPEEPVVPVEPVVPEEPVVTEEPQPEEEPEEEPEEQPQEELTIEKTGTITAWNGGSTCTIRFADGETKKLALTSATSIEGGFSPEVDDVVSVIFSQSDSSALKIQLLERPEKEEKTLEEEEETFEEEEETLEEEED